VQEREQEETSSIPYVPVVDEVQEAIAKEKDFSYKIKLPFLIHMQQTKSTCK
jgi:hypothetical protein